MKGFNSTYKYDFICLSETYLDSSAPDSLLNIEGYNLVQADHPDNIKRGGVCIYYKETFSIRVVSLSYINEAILIEIDYNNKKVILSVIYRSPSQGNQKFDSFLTNFQKLLNEISIRKPSLSIITGDFNARSSHWWVKDIYTTEESKLFSESPNNVFSQLINELTHIQTNNSSCTDLIFTNQPMLLVNSGVRTYLHPNCQHQIVYSSFNLNIYYPPPYQCLIWDYKNSITIL